MKRYSAYALALCAALGCNKTEDVWDELTEAQRAEARQLAAAQCATSSNGAYESFTALSADVFSSTDWQRNDAWKYTLKNGETPEITHSIRVWKNTGTTLYLHVNRTFGVSTTSSFFLRITSAMNAAMIEDLQDQMCASTAVSGQVSGQTIRLKREKYSPTTGTTNKHTDTYSFNFDHLAYVGGAFPTQRIVYQYNTNGQEISATTLTGSFGLWTDAEELPTTAPADSKFCDLAAQGVYSGETGGDSYYRYPLEIDLATCEDTAVAAGWGDFDL